MHEVTSSDEVPVGALHAVRRLSRLGHFALTGRRGTRVAGGGRLNAIFTVLAVVVVTGA